MSNEYRKPAIQVVIVDRRCLMCSSDFPSEGAHNRICGKCKSSRTWRHGSPVSTMTSWKAAS